MKIHTPLRYVLLPLTENPGYVADNNLIILLLLGVIRFRLDGVQSLNSPYGVQ